MTVDTVRAVGEAAYGQDWQSPLARALGRSPRLVRMWVAGTRPLPDWLPAALADLLRRLADAKVAEARRLRRMAETIQAGNTEGAKA